MLLRFTLILFLTIPSILLSGCSGEQIRLAHYELNSKIPEAINIIIASSQDGCSKIYKFENIWVLEQHCSSKKDNTGIYILDSEGLRQFSWYDIKFNEWAWSEGCNNENDCYYVVNVDSDGKVIEISYYFYINLSEGYYNLLVRKQLLKINKKVIKDHPS